MKKFIAVMIVLMLVLAMPVMAFAEELPIEALPPEEVHAPFFIEYGWEIFTGLVILAIVVFAIIKFAKTPRKEQKEKLRQWLLQAVIKAEAIYGSKTGELKLSFVYDLFLQHVPWLGRIIPFSLFSDKVKEALEEMRKLLEVKPEILEQARTAVADAAK